MSVFLMGDSVVSAPLVSGSAMSGLGVVRAMAGEAGVGLAVPSLWAVAAGVAVALCLAAVVAVLRRERRHRLRSVTLLGGDAHRGGSHRGDPQCGYPHCGDPRRGDPHRGDGSARWRWARARRGPGAGSRAAPVARGGRGAASGGDGATGARGNGAGGGGWPGRGGDQRSRSVRDHGLSLAVGTVGPLLVGGVAGVLVGVGACGVTGFLLRRRATEAPAPGPSAAERAAAEQVPLAAELLAACLAAGSGPGEAAGAVGGSLGGPLGERLRRASAELRLGGDPAEVWGRFGALPGTRTLARRMERAGISGVPTVEAMARLAANQRSRRTRWAQERARRAAVLVTGPLGLCFLPAFLVVGVVPVVIGLARSLL